MNKKGYEVAGQNVFKDIGSPNAEEHVVKPDISKDASRRVSAILG